MPKTATLAQQRALCESLDALKIRAQKKRMSEDTHIKHFVNATCDFVLKLDADAEIGLRATRRIRRYKREFGW